MKLLCTLVLLALYVNSNGQTIAILDAASRAPVSFTTVIATYKGGEVMHSYCNQDGSITITAKSFDTISFTCLGYRDKAIAKASLGTEVLLEPNAYELNEVVINSPANVVTVGYIDKKKLDFSGTAQGFQDAVYIPNTLGQRAYVKAFMFKIVESKNRFAYRLHFYKPSKDKRHPGQEITQANIIGFVEKKAKGLTELNLKGFRVEFPLEGVYVSIEGLGPCDANGAVTDDKNAYITYEVFQSAEPIFCHHPEYFIEDGWINENERTLRDYKENYGIEAPKEELRVPSFGLKVAR